MPKPLLFKVLVDGVSPLCGDPFPPLGIWTEPAKPRLGISGCHLTSDPLRWWLPGAWLYFAEGRGQVDSDGGDLCAYESARLICRLGAAGRMLPSGWFTQQPLVSGAGRGRGPDKGLPWKSV